MLIFKKRLLFARIAICLLFEGLLLFATPIAVHAAEPLDCLSCHEITLEYHDRLGSGNNACWSCHSSADMDSLVLANDTKLPLATPNELCGQCHEERYNSWNEGTHGFPGTLATGKCTDCHDPHEPQMAFLGITKQHPEATSPAPALPINNLMIAVVSLGFLIFLLIIVLISKEETM